MYGWESIYCLFICTLVFHPLKLFMMSSVASCRFVFTTVVCTLWVQCKLQIYFTTVVNTLYVSTDLPSVPYSCYPWR